MNKSLLAVARRPHFRQIKRLAFLMRGLVFLGRRYRCPCCQWRIRGFVDRWGFFATSENGYCPRCNAKARHRRIWLYLQQHTNLLTEQHRLLEVAPWWSFARRFSRMSHLEYVAMDIDSSAAFVTVAGDIADAPIGNDSFDAILCVHVLEHVVEDRAAIHNLMRMLKPGGWALISVPLLTNESTREDPTVTSPEDRERLFGEKGHVRYYGTDFRTRLESAGFEVEMDDPGEIGIDDQVSFGLKNDEYIFCCKKVGP